MNKKGQSFKLFISSQLNISRGFFKCRYSVSIKQNREGTLLKHFQLLLHFGELGASVFLSVCLRG